MGFDNVWLRRFHPSPDAPVRLVCLPYAGGSASFYFPLSRALAPRVDVLAVQYPGRQDRLGEPGITSLPELADRIADVLGDGWTDRPLAFFGHSMGAVLAYEIAARLESAGTIPLTLFLSGRRAPSTHRVESVHLRSDAELLAELKRLDGPATEALADKDLLQLVLPALRSDYQAVETHRHIPRPALAAPFVVLTGDSDPRVSAEEAAAWAEHTASHFTLRTFAGGHFYLTEHWADVLAVIQDSVRTTIRPDGLFPSR